MTFNIYIRATRREEIPLSNSIYFQFVSIAKQFPTRRMAFETGLCKTFFRGKLFSAHSQLTWDRHAALKLHFLLVLDIEIILKNSNWFRCLVIFA